MLLDIEIRIVESATEEWHRIVAPGAPARRLHTAITLERHFARLLDAEQIRLVVERNEVARAAQPTVRTRPLRDTHALLSSTTLAHKTNKEVPCFCKKSMGGGGV